MCSQIIKLLKDKQNKSKSDFIFFSFHLPTSNTRNSLDLLLFSHVVFITEALIWPDHLNLSKASSMSCLPAVAGLGTPGTSKRVPWDMDFFVFQSTVH